MSSAMMTTKLGLRPCVRRARGAAAIRRENSRRFRLTMDPYSNLRRRESAGGGQSSGASEGKLERELNLPRCAGRGDGARVGEIDLRIGSAECRRVEGIKEFGSEF